MSLNIEELRGRIRDWKAKLARDPQRASRDRQERAERIAYYKAHSADRIRSMDADEFYDYIAKLWAMRSWSNKKYVVDKIIEENGFEKVKDELAKFVWGELPIEERWDNFRSTITGMGPAMMSEILSHSRPNEYLLWNRRAYVGLRYLGLEDLPRYNYQVTGKRYRALCDAAIKMVGELRNAGIADADLLTLDYFIWDELQVEENLNQIHRKTDAIVADEASEPIATDEPGKPEAAKASLHDEVRDKLEQIGVWLGFDARTEVRVSAGAVVDVVWEFSIANLGRVIYVFEVQSKGSIDSMVLNLLRSLNNPAVQGIVAVSDAVQIEKLRVKWRRSDLFERN